MRNYEEKLLTLLVEKYGKSSKDRGSNKILRRTVVKPEKIYALYRDNVNGDWEKINEVNALVSRLADRGWVTAEKRAFSTEIEGIYLCDGALGEVEQYLAAEYGYVPKDAQLEQLSRLINQYQQVSPMCAGECGELQKLWEQRKIPPNLEEWEDIFKALAFAEKNDRPLYIREMSMAVFGDSKYLEKQVLPALCRIVQKYYPVPEDEGMVADEVLEQLQIFKEPQKIRLQGNIVLVLKGKAVDCSPFAGGLEFTAAELTNLEKVLVGSGNFLTIENLTSFLRFKPQDTVTFYLGGYCNRFQREFLKKVFADNSQVRYAHFGDLDAGGFLIHQHLCRVTGIPFALFAMSRVELQDSRYAHCLHPLTDLDRTKLQALLAVPAYQATVAYMLEHNIKLEQEIVGLAFSI